jgi:hypothetical protein
VSPHASRMHRQVIRRSRQRFVCTIFFGKSIYFFGNQSTCFYCSLSNSRLAKANTAAFRCVRPCDLTFRIFNDLDCRQRLARQMPLNRAAITGNRPGSDHGFILGDLFMLDGKNNRLLDSFSFRFLITAAAFVAWAGASYALLSLT